MGNNLNAVRHRHSSYREEFGRAFFYTFGGIARDPVTCEKGLMVLITGKVCTGQAPQISFCELFPCAVRGRVPPSPVTAPQTVPTYQQYVQEGGIPAALLIC